MSDTQESKRYPARSSGRSHAGVAGQPLSGGLYLVATPIGHARDITLRALDVLAGADILAAEDTRRTRQLLDLHGISLNGRPLVSYHDRNGPARRPQIVGWLEQGKSVAYASDAGTPLIADPGYRLAQAARDGGFEVIAIPGPSAVLAGLSVAGLPTDKFFFGGFLPPKRAARRAALADLASIPGTLVFFEAPRRAADTLSDMALILGGDRAAAVTRELTKAFEEVQRGTLASLAEATANTPLRGEVVILVEAQTEGARQAVAEANLDDAILEALETYSVKEASRFVADRLRLPKRDVYARALQLQEQDKAD